MFALLEDALAFGAVGNLPGARAAHLTMSPPSSVAAAPSVPSRNNVSSVTTGFEFKIQPALVHHCARENAPLLLRMRRWAGPLRPAPSCLPPFQGGCKLEQSLQRRHWHAYARELGRQFGAKLWDMDITVPATGDRCIEVHASALPIHYGTQLAVYITPSLSQRSCSRWSSPLEGTQGHRHEIPGTLVRKPMPSRGELAAARAREASPALRRSPFLFFCMASEVVSHALSLLQPCFCKFPRFFASGRFGAHRRGRSSPDLADVCCLVWLWCCVVLCCVLWCRMRWCVCGV